MAIAPTATTTTRRKPQGPRIQKPRTLFVAVNGDQLEVFEANELEKLVDLQTGAPGQWKVMKKVLEVKKRSNPAPASAQPSA